MMISLLALIGIILPDAKMNQERRKAEGRSKVFVLFLVQQNQRIAEASE